MVSHADRVAADDLQELVRRAKQNDADAWEVLYRRAYPGLLAYARRRLPRRDEADDAVSETFARACTRIGAFEWAGAGFNGWLFGILRNVVLENQRRHHRNAQRLSPEVVAIQGDVSEGLLMDEEAAIVRAAFAQLSADDQEVLELRVVGGLGADEVATALGKRAGAVRMAQSRALGRLRATLGEAEPNG